MHTNTHARARTHTHTQVRLGDADIFEHLLARQRQVVWSYGTVCLSQTSIEQIDTFRLVLGEPENGTGDQWPSFWRQLSLPLLPACCGGLTWQAAKSTPIFPEDVRQDAKSTSTVPEYVKYLARERKQDKMGRLSVAVEHEHQDPFWRSALEVMVDHEVRSRSSWICNM